MNAQEHLQEALLALQGRPYGPAYDPEHASAAGAACVALCEGDQDKARTLWKLIVSDLEVDYMPHAAVVALLRAANTVNLTPDIEPPDLDAVPR